ncbi:MAG TPA: GNAT family N-acetyltransferase [Candidatus Eisenbacteria bacterium]|nr:GNAT family N-acetyltransferase [Candidatus Eisenbacteria bacterium]
MRRTAAIRVAPATPDRWDDLEQLFGPRGACAGCWCMWWRLRRSEWSQGKGEGNRRALRALVRSGEPSGLIAYSGKEPVGWIAVAPRAAYPGLDRSRTLKPVDERPVWSVTCFFTAREHRRRGVTVKLLEAAAKHARSRGADCLEGYPVEPRKDSVPDVWVFTGLAGAFRKAGFVEVARRSETRPIMRRELRAKPRASRGRKAARA